MLVNSLVCWFCTSALGLVPFQIFNIFQTCKLLRTVMQLLCSVSLWEYELFYIPPEDKKSSTFQQTLWTNYGDNEHHLISHKLKTTIKTTKNRNSSLIPSSSQLLNWAGVGATVVLSGNGNSCAFLTPFWLTAVLSHDLTTNKTEKAKTDKQKRFYLTASVQFIQAKWVAFFWGGGGGAAF